MRQFRQLDSAVTLGVKANDIVSAAGRLERGGESSSSEDRKALTMARAHLQTLVAESDEPVGTRAELGDFDGGEAAQTTLQAVKQMRPPGDAEEAYVRRLITTLDRALNGEHWPERSDDLRELRLLFLRVAELSLHGAVAMVGNDGPRFPAF